LTELCATPDDGPEHRSPRPIPGVALSQWYWAATLTNIADGIGTITINNPKSQSGVATGVSRFPFANEIEPDK